MDIGQQSIFELFQGPTTTNVPTMVATLSRLPAKAAEASNLIREWVTEASSSMPDGLNVGISLTDDAGRGGIIRAMTMRCVDGHEAIAVLLEGDDRYRRFDLIQGIRLHPIRGLITPTGRHLMADIPGLRPVPGDRIGQPTWSSDDAQDQAVEPITIGTTVHLGDRWEGTTPATVVGYRGFWLAIAHGDEPIQILPVHHVHPIPYEGASATALKGLSDADRTACETASSLAMALRRNQATALSQRVEHDIAEKDHPLDRSDWLRLFSHVRALRDFAAEDDVARQALAQLTDHLTWRHVGLNGIVLHLGPSPDEEREYLQARITIPDLPALGPWARWVSFDEAIRGGAWSENHADYLAKLAKACEREARAHIADTIKEEAKKAAAKRKLMLAQAPMLATHLINYGGVSPSSETMDYVSRLKSATTTSVTTEALATLIDQACVHLSALTHPLAVRLMEHVMSAILRFEVPADDVARQLQDLRPLLASELHADIYGATNAAALFADAFRFSGRILELAPGEWACIEAGSCGWDTHGAISETGYRSVSNHSDARHAECDVTLKQLHAELLAHKPPKRGRSAQREDSCCQGIAAATAAAIMHRHAHLPLIQRRQAIQHDVDDLRIGERVTMLHAGLSLLSNPPTTLSLDPWATWMGAWSGLSGAQHRVNEHLSTSALNDVALVIRDRLEHALAAMIPSGTSLLTYRAWGGDHSTQSLGKAHTLVDSDGTSYPFPGSGLASAKLTDAIANARSTKPESLASEEGAHDTAQEDDETGDDSEVSHDGDDDTGDDGDGE